MMVSFEHSGSFKHMESFLKSMLKLEIKHILEQYGQKGIAALASAIPTDSGKAAASWGYEVKQAKSGCAIFWTNSDNENGFPVAVMIQYGYGTGTGGYVQGRDYINPAIQPIFDKIAEQVWKEVTSL
jgi:hypothetical protein